MEIYLKQSIVATVWLAQTFSWCTPPHWTDRCKSSLPPPPSPCTPPAKRRSPGEESMDSTKEWVERPRLEDRWCSGISPPSGLLPPRFTFQLLQTKRRLLLNRGGQFEKGEVNSVTLVRTSEAQRRHWVLLPESSVLALSWEKTRLRDRLIWIKICPNCICKISASVRRDLFHRRFIFRGLQLSFLSLEVYRLAIRWWHCIHLLLITICWGRLIVLLILLVRHLPTRRTWC